MKYRETKHILLTISIAFSLIIFVVIIEFQNDINSFIMSILYRGPEKYEESVVVTDYVKPNSNFNPILPQINENPSSNYPPYSTLLDIVKYWNPDNPNIPTDFKEVLQHFNYSNPHELALAEKYRDMELPFKLYDVPEFKEVSRKWTDEYLIAQLKISKKHVERSINNHFMYWTLGRNRKISNYTPPTAIIEMSFNEWLSKAKYADNKKLSNNSDHYYFMTAAPPKDRKATFVARDLQLFSTNKDNFFITNVAANKGIQCRFGMRGIISESHFDSGRNMVAMLKGAKRYILTPPQACQYLGIISDRKHPSYRHSIIDWSDVKQAEASHFDKVDSIDTIVKEGEVLYIPSFWFHYIVSLQYSIQCNSRSGTPPSKDGAEDIEKCLDTTLDFIGYNKESKSKKKKKKKHPKKGDDHKSLREENEEENEEKESKA